MLTLEIKICRTQIEKEKRIIWKICTIKENLCWIIQLNVFKNEKMSPLVSKFLRSEFFKIPRIWKIKGTFKYHKVFWILKVCKKWKASAREHTHTHINKHTHKIKFCKKEFQGYKKGLRHLLNLKIRKIWNLSF